MKRIYRILVAMSLLAAAAVACSGAASPPEATVAVPADPTDMAAPPAPAPTDAPAETPPPAGTATTEPTATAQPTATDEPTPEPTATATPEPTPEPTATEPPTAEAARPGNASLTIEDFRFEPGSITVRVGSTVTWTHVGNARHTVTADDGSFDSGNLSSLETFDFTFSAAGTYAYFCRLHGGPGQEGMSAVITVTD